MALLQACFKFPKKCVDTLHRGKREGRKERKERFFLPFFPSFPSSDNKKCKEVCETCLKISRNYHSTLKVSLKCDFSVVRRKRRCYPLLRNLPHDWLRKKRLSIDWGQKLNLTLITRNSSLLFGEGRWPVFSCIWFTHQFINLLAYKSNILCPFLSLEELLEHFAFYAGFIICRTSSNSHGGCFGTPASLSIEKPSSWSSSYLLWHLLSLTSCTPLTLTFFQSLARSMTSSSRSSWF